MERLADYIRRVTELESEGKVSGVKSSGHSVEQDPGRNRPGQCDTTGGGQDCGSFRQPIRPVERQA